MDTQNRITVKIGDKSFPTTHQLLIDNSEYFEKRFQREGRKDEISIPDGQSSFVFEHVLKYFEDITYDIPNEYIERIKFYLIK